ncbi:hypothetical protein NQ317_003444 [Molorchus minor]|uniref:Uncharacterized protein n=1 Tax=Molorchus minor TaxID=1323400 RepID=A0ABQ9J4K5_9CUCU|nr:hypothetical protein NQ317_003444 [Molorchus minor]
MALIHMFCFPLVILFIFVCRQTYCEIKKFPLMMPNVYPDRDELYLCTPVRVVDNKKFLHSRI